MLRQRIRPRQLAPWVMGGASGAHIVVRMWRLSRAPASDVPLKQFLLANSDIPLVLCGESAAVWFILRRYDQPQSKWLCQN
jgi:hypothetical protein